MTDKKLAIIVPFRNRYDHLRVFIPHMKSRLPDAQIIVVEQYDQKPFNRAKLLNIGFLFSDADYMAFHDVDMLPTKANYSYVENPTHLATKAQQFGYKMPFPEYFGGVTLFNREKFEKVNGYSNEFWGWGGEDDEMYRNCIGHGLKIDRREGHYKSLPHPRKIDPKLHKVNCDLLARGRSNNDGLTACCYKLLSNTSQLEYEKITVNL